MENREQRNLNRTNLSKSRNNTLNIPSSSVSASVQKTAESSESATTIVMYAVIIMIIVALVGGILASINYYTQDRIAQNDAAQVNSALKTIFPDADEFDNVYSELNDTSLIPGVSAIYKAYSGEELLGYCTQVTADGFGNDGIDMIVGSDTLNQVVLISVLDNSETPGKGADILDPDEIFLQQFKGLARPIEFTSNVTAVTGATITSEGVRNGVNIALKAVDIVRISIDNTVGGTNE